jgi:ribosomal protein S18 acetylase RimI-like enzyme
MANPVFYITTAVSTADLDVVAHLFRAYAAAIGVDLGYQDFEKELATLPGKYASPSGALLIARDNEGVPIGCVALRPMAPDGCCEMKRLYVSPAARGLGLGRALLQAILTEAARLGYHEIRLDTLPTMTEAIAMYGKAGFETIAPYYDTAPAGTIFMRRLLESSSSGLNAGGGRP